MALARQQQKSSRKRQSLRQVERDGMRLLHASNKAKATTIIAPWSDIRVSSACDLQKANPNS
jgi:hypothetical protein